MNKELQCPCCENYISTDDFLFAENGRKQYFKIKRRIRELRKPIRKLIKEKLGGKA